MTRADLAAVYDGHADAVFRFAYRMMGAAGPAEDVVQDCFVALARGAAAYDPALGTMRVFLLGVARRIVLRHWRSEDRFEPMEEDGRTAAPIDLEGLEVAAAVAAGVQSLPPLQREAEGAGGDKRPNRGILHEDRGRFLFSLFPHPELGFEQAGSVSRLALRSEWAGDTFELFSLRRIAPGAGPYYIYVAHDPGFRPVGVFANEEVYLFSAGPPASALRR